MKVVAASEVRAWAVGKGLNVAETRGRLSTEVVQAFNKAHKSKAYVAGGPEPTITVKVPTTDKRGRSITKSVEVPAAELRSAIGAEGQRGRVNTEDAVQYVIGAGLI